MLDRAGFWCFSHWVWDLLGVIRQQWHLSALGLWQLYPFSCCRTSGMQCGSQQAHDVATIPACRQLWRPDQEAGRPKAWVWSQGSSPAVRLEASRSPRLPEVVLPCSEETAEPHCPRMCLRMLVGNFIKPTASIIYLLGSPSHCLWEKIKKHSPEYSEPQPPEIPHLIPSLRTQAFQKHFDSQCPYAFG